MKRVFLYLGMGSCVSKKSSPKLPPPPPPPPTITTTTTTTAAMEKPVVNHVQPSIWQVAGSKEEQFFDSKAWLESDDEDFVSVNGDASPTKQLDKDGEHQGRRLSDLFKESSSFSSDNQTSIKAAQVGIENKQKSATTTTTNNNSSIKLERKKSVKRCLPSLVRSLSCGKRPSHVAVAG
ncbi:uncharacterized protein LOC141644401 [Silene latifolia]|uniref:uncharacterized protein LOC141644401 n=1 Tax=Silene latifolia TaxID=37657 RepID=UPI003D777629